MGQIEVYELLKNRLASGDDRFFSVAEIEKMMKDAGYTNGMIHSIRGQLLKLELSGYLDVKMSGKFRDWRRLFRIKKKYVEVQHG